MKDQSFTEIHVCSPFCFDFKAVKRLYRAALLESIDVIWNVEGSKKEKAKFM